MKSFTLVTHGVSEIYSAKDTLQQQIVGCWDLCATACLGCQFVDFEYRAVLPITNQGYNMLCYIFIFSQINLGSTVLEMPFRHDGLNDNDLQIVF